ncbi:ABC transporter permease [Methanofollis tationis]|uniref:ABC transporter permease n=1 Tax=Methanofollis tationis TaxID=81417 RepID=A0A7K4HMP3_9EURY|nr:ABC transporter permease [Methanofollis tationis]NVO66545.1 ABC transporter permease [Methanofollis tationis]
MGYIIDGLMEAFHLIVSLDPDVMEITVLSLIVSLTATVVATTLALPFGTAIKFTEFPGKKVLINLIQTLYSLPTVLVGLLVFLLITRHGPLGFAGLLFTPQAMILAQTILILPIMVGLTISALSGVDETIRDTIISLGATRLQFLTSIVREARFAIFAAVVVGFGRAISEVGAAILIGGNIAHRTRVLTTAISLNTSQWEIGTSIALGIVLLAIALVVNTGVTLFQQR